MANLKCSFEQASQCTPPNICNSLVRREGLCSVKLCCLTEYTGSEFVKAMLEQSVEKLKVVERIPVHNILQLFKPSVPSLTLLSSD